MDIIRSITEMQAWSQDRRWEGRSIGFVPTMGCFHEGHLSLMREAKRQCDLVVVSLFVNPKQFGPNEDFSSYPSDEARDKELAEKEGVDALFTPERDAMYPQPFFTSVEVEKITGPLCGLSRPEHFKGVTTVVAKLFNSVLPDKAFFGFKDAQQALVIRAMVRDLNFPLEVVVCPTVREGDGLALSSRNKRLSSDERKSALSLSQALQWAKSEFEKGERDAEMFRQGTRERIEAMPHTKIDYVEVSDPETLEPLSQIKQTALLSLAVFVGKTRLIDNMLLEKKT